jgi:hypothetical protein
LLGTPPLVTGVLPEMEFTIESTTGPDTDNVSPFPKASCAREPDAGNDATLDLTTAVRLCNAVPAVSNAKDWDGANIVVGFVVGGFVIRDPPLLERGPAKPPRFRPRGEPLQPLGMPTALLPPPPPDPEPGRVSVKGDASALVANPRNVAARITRNVRAREHTLSIRFVITMGSHPVFFAAREMDPWHGRCNSSAGVSRHCNVLFAQIAEYGWAIV